MVDRPPTIKWVKKANMWCISSVKDGKQTIVWSAEKPELAL